MRTNCLLPDFSFSECSTLSHLFNTYCMNIYGSPQWKYEHKKSVRSILCCMDIITA